MRGRSGVAAALLITCLAIAGSDRAATPAAGTTQERVPIHSDPVELERSMLDTVLAMVRSDAVAARSALDRMEKSCRRVRRDEPGGYPNEVAAHDTAFHLSLDRARELAGAGDADEASQQLWWILAACRDCHQAARKSGIPVEDRGKDAPQPRH